MAILLYTIHVLTCLFLILVVLLQQGKGADLSVFGGGATMTAFGARGAASLLHKLTVGAFVLFIVTTLAIGVVQNRSASTVMAGVEEEAAPSPEPATSGEEGVTGALPEGQPSAMAPAEEGAEGEVKPESETFEPPAAEGGDAGTTDPGAADSGTGDAGDAAAPAGESGGGSNG